MNFYTTKKHDLIVFTLLCLASLSSQPSYAGEEELQKLMLNQGSCLQKKTSKRNLKSYFQAVENISPPKLITLSSLISAAYALASNKDATSDQLTKAILLAQFYAAKASLGKIRLVLDFAERVANNTNTTSMQIEKILALAQFCTQKIDTESTIDISFLFKFVETLFNNKNVTSRNIEEILALVHSVTVRLPTHEMWRVLVFAKAIAKGETALEQTENVLVLVQSCIQKINTDAIVDVCHFFDFVERILHNKNASSKNIKELLALVHSVAVRLPAHEMWRVAIFATKIASREVASLKHTQKAIELLKLCREKGYENDDHLKKIAERLASKVNATPEELATALDIDQYCRIGGNGNILPSLINKAVYRWSTLKEIRHTTQLLMNLARHGEKTAYKRIVSHLADKRENNALQDDLESSYPGLKPHLWLEHALLDDANILANGLNLSSVTYESIKNLFPEEMAQCFEGATMHTAKLLDAVSVPYNCEDQDFQAAVKLSQRMLQIRLTMKRVLKNDFCFIAILPEVYRFLHPKGDKHPYSALIGNCFETYAIESLIEGEQKPQVNYYATLLPENVLQCRKLLSFFQEDAPNHLNKKEKRKFNQNNEEAFDAFGNAIRTMGKVKRYTFSRNKTYKEKGKEFLLSCPKLVQASQSTDELDGWVAF